MTDEPLKITNADFIAAVFGDHAPEGASPTVCTKGGDPGKGGWSARRVDDPPPTLSSDANNFLNCSSFFPGNDGRFRARKADFAACHFLMLDDVGTKGSLERLGDFKPSWLIETSPGNFQAGILLEAPLTNGDDAVRVLDALLDAGLGDPDAKSPSTRWARLPVAINGKPEHLDDAGAPFRCRLVEWRPESRYTPEQIVNLLGLELAQAGRPKPAKATRQPLELADEPPVANDTECAVVIAALDRADNDLARSDWVRLCLAVKGVCQDRAREAFLRFSYRYADVTRGAPEHLWDTASPDGSLTLGTAYQLLDVEADITEDGAARAFTARFGDGLRFDHDIGAWFRWDADAGRWAVDTKRRAFDWCRSVAHDLSEGLDFDTRAKVRKRSRPCENSIGIP